MMRHLIAFFALAGLTACSGQHPATPAANDPGAAKVESVCKDCHGPRGRGQGRFPRLAGRPASELVGLLRRYKSGHKNGNMSDTMRPFAQTLTDQEIDQVAAYLAAQ